jgi:hypothetical protein
MRISPDSLPKIEDGNGYIGQWAELNGLHFAFEKCPAGYTIQPLLAAFPDHFCPVAHWGYMFRGKVLVKYADGTEETFSEGDAYYVPPGHQPYFLEDSELLQITHKAEHEGLIKAIVDAGLMPSP